MTTIKDLLQAGYIQVGQEIIWKSRAQGESHKASISVNGEIRTADGNLHRTPSGALKHLNGNKPVDGWLAWKLSATGESLSSIRAKAV